MLGAGVLALLGYVLVSALLAPDVPPEPSANQLTMHKVVAQGGNASLFGWRFSADSNDLNSDGTLLTYHRVHGAYYRAGKPLYSLTASQIILDLRNGNYTATGGVHVATSPHSEKLQSLTTVEVLWSNAVATLTCPGTVHLRYGGSALETSELAVNFNTGQTTFGKTALNL
ncbi:MAG: hypothetical protein M3T49_05910 [Candidatus Eremiobacteraeota bacterium]|nr:hypothetical protein [Candidatus Eremiobacteraeota bacterium]